MLCNFSRATAYESPSAPCANRDQPKPNFSDNCAPQDPTNNNFTNPWWQTTLLLTETSDIQRQVQQPTPFVSPIRVWNPRPIERTKTTDSVSSRGALRLGCFTHVIRKDLSTIEVPWLKRTKCLTTDQSWNRCQNWRPITRMKPPGPTASGDSEDWGIQEQIFTNWG